VNDEQILLTPAGRARLQAELEHLRSVRRPQVAQQLREAVDEGDLSENSGYEDAKHEQAFVEGRILTLETLLRKAVVVEDRPASDAVGFGSWVTVAEQGHREETFQIVGSAEVDPGNGRISNESPLGKALLGKKAGDGVAVETPDGLSYFEILDIR
jgi:transcription elongation factor GreA